ncbi:MAG: NHLP bacteriocin export ABC transporter permease/ATPase subunit [Bacteroidota bacterium]
MPIKPLEIRLGANKPFVLSKHDCAWIVVSGEVEVYYAQLNEDGKLQSPRNYLYTAHKGEMLFSLKEASTLKGINLMAVSAEAKLIELRKEYLTNLNANQLGSKVDKWVLKLAECLQTQPVPRIYTPLEADSNPIIDPQEIAFPTKGLKWVKLDQGEIDIYGEAETPVPNQEKILKGLIPVSHDLWIQAKDTAVKLEVYPTIDVVQDEISLMLALQYLQQFFYLKIEQRFRANRLEAEADIQGRLMHNQSMIEHSLDGLKAIVKEKDSQSFASVHNHNHLLAACQLIGREIGFDFEDPKLKDQDQSTLMHQLKAIAQVSNVRVRKVILRGEWWKEENGHLLAFHQGTKAPLALVQKDATSYLIKDPSTKSSQLVTADLAADLEPMAYMFFYAFDRKIDSIKQIGLFALKGLKKDIGLIMLATLFGSLLTMLVPILSGVLFDDVIPQADRGFLIEVVGIMVIIGVLSAMLGLIRGVLQLRVETKSNINIQAALMDHLLRLPVTFYRQFSAGDLTLRTLGINAIRQVLSATLLRTVLSGAFSIVNVVLLFYYDPNLAWIGLGLVILAVGVMLGIGFYKLKFDREIAQIQGDIQGFLFEFISGISKIRISGAEQRIFAIWANKFGLLKMRGFKSVNLENLSVVFNGSYTLLTNMFFFAAIFFIIQKDPSKSLISVGVFMAFVSAFRQFLNDSLSISEAIIASLNIIPLYERMRPIMEAEPESYQGSADPGELQGEIEVNAVTFRYHQDQAPVLKNVSFRIKPGEMVAFVGPSGSGKSTVMRLLLGFEEAETGSIYYDGQAFESLSKELVRQQMGVVLQDSALMAGSIYMNIVGNSDLTLEDAVEAANMAGLEEDIAQMPMGMHTMISEGASTFSGGQRQRLMIARAIVNKPRILFMDEATSALDNRTQSIVSESLEKLQATRIVIAHRLSTVINADRIFVMEDGEIVESGSYRELIKQDGLFAKLAKRQIA